MENFSKTVEKIRKPADPNFTRARKSASQEPNTQCTKLHVWRNSSMSLTIYNNDCKVFIVIAADQCGNDSFEEKTCKKSASTHIRKLQGVEKALHHCQSKDDIYKVYAAIERIQYAHRKGF